MSFSEQERQFFVQSVFNGGTLCPMWLWILNILFGSKNLLEILVEEESSKNY